MAESVHNESAGKLREEPAGVGGLLDELAVIAARAGRQRSRLIREVSEELRVHAAIEEEVFYPALRAAAERAGAGGSRAVAAAYEEHRAAVRRVLAELERTLLGSPPAPGPAVVLENPVDHAADERAEEMFKAARRLVASLDIASLGEALRRRTAATSQAASAPRDPPESQGPPSPSR